MLYFQTYPSNDVVGLGDQPGEEILEAAWVPKISDIAHSLSMLCRFGGHIRTFYSVAQHCVLCADAARDGGYLPVVQLACLLHDASEAYVQDVLGPIKKVMRAWEKGQTSYDAVESAFQERITLTFLGSNASVMFTQLINYYDIAMYVTESQQLRDEALLTTSYNAEKFPIALPIIIEPWAQGETRRRFLGKFADLESQIR